MSSLNDEKLNNCDKNTNNAANAPDGVIKSDLTIDCLGLYCPVPVMNAQKALENMKPDEVLEILATDEGVKSDFPLFCKSRKLKLLNLSEENGEFKIYIKK